MAEIVRLFNARVTQSAEWPERIYPRITAPVVISVDGDRRIGPMAWGFPVEVEGKTKRITKHITNARVLSSPFWRGALTRHRCLVPFTEFAEPRPGKDAQGLPAQWWFSISDQAIAAFAGLWRPTEHGPVVAFCTTEPNALVAPLHPKTMPVVLLREDHERWLDGSVEDALTLQAPYPSQFMKVEPTIGGAI